MSYLKLIVPLSIILNGCGGLEPKPIPEVQVVKQECVYPKMPLYRVPKSREIQIVEILPNGNQVIRAKDIQELVDNNTKLRRICNKYRRVNIKANKLRRN